MDECDCRRWIHRAGVHLPGCPLHPDNLISEAVQKQDHDAQAEGDDQATNNSKTK